MKNYYYWLSAFFGVITFVTMSITDVNAQVSPYSLSPDWYFGQGGRLTFPGNNFPTSGAPAASYKGTNTSVGVEASTSVCFNNGAVALYTNSMQVYNANPANAAWTDYMRSLTADNTCAGSSTGACVAFPDPAAPTTAMYLIMANDVTSGGCAGQGVNRYRFTLSGAYMAYNAGPVNMAPNAFAGEAITAGTDGTGGYWLVVHNKSTANTFRVWHFTSGGISASSDYTVGAAVSDVSGSQSYLKISPCQNMIAYHSGGTLVVHNWDRTTGVVGAEIRRISPADYGVGLEFSPDGSRIYYSGQGGTVNYVVISSGATGSVASSGSWSMQLGNDGKIYTSPGGGSIGVISTPNTAPSYSTLALGGGTTFRGLSNIAWLTPTTPDFTPAITNCDVDFTHLFQNYFLTNVAVNTPSFSWNFGDGNTATGTTTPSHTYAASGTYNVSLSFTDTYCGQTWTRSKNVTVSCPMPVDWLDIDAVYNNGAVDVTWSTAMEANNDYFEVQRSIDGINFVTIGTVNSKGNSNRIQNYSFTDLSPIAGGSYYRIVQHDIDGKSTNSPNAFVNITSVVVNVNPNPSSSDFDLTVSGASSVTVIVTDVLGRVVYQNDLTGNVITTSFGSELTNGTYSLQVITDGNSYTEKIVKN